MVWLRSSCIRNRCLNKYVVRIVGSYSIMALCLHPWAIKNVASRASYLLRDQTFSGYSRLPRGAVKLPGGFR